MTAGKPLLCLLVTTLYGESSRNPYEAARYIVDQYEKNNSKEHYSLNIFFTMSGLELKEQSLIEEMNNQITLGTQSIPDYIKNSTNCDCYSHVSIPTEQIIGCQNKNPTFFNTKYSVIGSAYQNYSKNARLTELLISSKLSPLVEKRVIVKLEANIMKFFGCPDIKSDIMIKKGTRIFNKVPNDIVDHFSNRYPDIVGHITSLNKWTPLRDPVDWNLIRTFPIRFNDLLSTLSVIITNLWEGNSDGHYYRAICGNTARREQMIPTLDRIQIKGEVISQSETYKSFLIKDDKDYKSFLQHIDEALKLDIKAYGILSLEVFEIRLWK